MKITSEITNTNYFENLLECFKACVQTGNKYGEEKAKEQMIDFIIRVSDVHKQA